MCQLAAILSAFAHRTIQRSEAALISMYERSVLIVCVSAVLSASEQRRHPHFAVRP
jgi:hypothetical protein